ncbi:MAG: hypothetical protein ACRDRV_08915 [Pseudonocardiaceae bacterium]
MSDDQGYIMKDQDSSEHGPDKDFEARDFYGNDRNEAGDADATGGDNKGDINLNIEQGGDAYARGGDVVTYESYEHHSYTQYKEPEYEEHDKHEEHDEHGKDHEYEESHESAENVF